MIFNTLKKSFLISIYIKISKNIKNKIKNTKTCVKRARCVDSDRIGYNGIFGVVVQLFIFIFIFIFYKYF